MLHKKNARQTTSISILKKVKNFKKRIDSIPFRTKISW